MNKSTFLSSSCSRESFTDIAFINEEAMGCINEKAIGAVNGAAIGAIIAPRNLPSCFFYFMLHCFSSTIR